MSNCIEVPRLVCSKFPLEPEYECGGKQNGGRDDSLDVSTNYGFDLDAVSSGDNSVENQVTICCPVNFRLL